MLPREIQTEHWPDRTSYDLPMRPIGWLRWFGLLPMLFAVVFAAVPAKIASFLLKPILEHHGSPVEWVGLAFVSLFVLVALMPFGLGLLIMAGRTRLVVERDRIIITEIAGPIRKRRKVKLQDMERLELVGSAGTASLPGFLQDLGGLGARLKNGKKMLLLLGYPRDWLEPLAQELSGLMQIQGAPVKIEHVSLAPDSSTPALEETVDKPAASRIEAKPGSNGLTLEIPPAGLRRGSKGLFTMGVIWCLFMAVFTFGWSRAGKASVPLGVWGFIAVFWLIGLTMLTSALNMARRRATFAAENGGLKIEQNGLFGAKAWQWRPGEIAAIRVGESGMRVNNVPVLELQVHPVQGRKKGFFGGRDEAELRWLASQLRRTLRVSADPTTQPQANVANA
jgi:hypothetical protein